MGHKRPFGDQESHEIACKHPRGLECSNQLNFLELVPCNDDLRKPHTSGDYGFSKSQGDKRLRSDSIIDISISANWEFATSPPGSISSLSWVTSSTSEEDVRSEAAVRGTFSPGYFESDHPVRALSHSEDSYSSLLDHPRRRLVSVGPDHQADVPVWGLQAMKNSTGYFEASDLNKAIPQSLGSDVVANDDNGEELMGTCVIPMPDSEPSAYNGGNVGDGKADCSCLDGGSVRCVRQHVMEAREKLKGTLGQERFLELGFCDMGEEMAWKWNEGEEQLFHEVVFSNPASLGKNFWDRLSVVFPSRTKKDLVSYYFNVFMLRKRAEQNRFDPLNIDSDDDEWQGSEDGDDELGMTEEYEDSVVESPVDRDDPGYNQDHEEDFHDGDDDDGHGDETSDNNENDGSVAGEENEGGVDDVSDTRIGKLLDGGSFEPKIQLPMKILPQYDGEDHDVHDDSCTSYECQPNGTDSCGYNGLSDRSSHGYLLLDPCDTKIWDIGYLSGPKKEADFLPTCNMIEEVFGEEAWNNKSRDGKSIC